jgi:hypothetical protein
MDAWLAQHSNNALFTPRRDDRFNGDPPGGDEVPVQVDFIGRAQNVGSRNSVGNALTSAAFLLHARGRIVWMNEETWDSFERLGIRKISSNVCTIIAQVRLEGGTQANLSAVVVYWGRDTGYESALALLTTCDCKKVRISNANSSQVSAFSLSRLLTHSRNLELILTWGKYDEDHVRALDTAGRTDLQIKYDTCDFTDAGLDVLLDSLRNNRGPTKIYSHNISSRRLAGALRENRSLEELALYSDLKKEDLILEEDKENNEGLHDLFQALKENRGLVRLAFGARFISDKNWSVLCDALGKHPTLECLDLWGTVGDIQDAAQKTTRMQSLLKMLQVNTMVHTIKLTPTECDMHIYTNAILPRLKKTPQFHSVSQTRGVLRSKLLGRALYSVNDNPTLLWMFLSNNIPTAFAGRM